MTPDADGLRALLRSESDLLLPQLDTLTHDHWNRQSPCEGWDVLDVLVHMQLGAMVHTGMVEDALAGRMEPPWTVPEGLDARTWFQQVHRDAHDEGPERNLAHLHQRLAGYRAALARVDDAALEREAWFYGLPATLRKVISAFVNDVIIHATDIRRPVGLEPWFSPDGARFAGQAVFAFLPTFVTAERLAGATGVVRHTIDGRTSLVELGAWGARRLPSAEGDANTNQRADATLTTDGGTWTLLAWRQLPVAEVEARGQVRIEGRRALVERYLAAIQTP